MRIHKGKCQISEQRITNRDKNAKSMNLWHSLNNCTIIVYGTIPGCQPLLEPLTLKSSKGITELQNLTDLNVSTLVFAEFCWKGQKNFEVSLNTPYLYLSLFKQI